MERIHFLSAEIFNYSYDNYQDHLGVNVRFDKLMPEEARLLESAVNNGWSAKKVAKKLDVTEKVARRLLIFTQEALDVVDAANPSESFRNSVRQSISYALKEGLESQESIENLVQQICYRAADLGVLLDQKGHRLAQYSRHLRREPDTEYYEGYFDEPFQD